MTAVYPHDHGRLPSPPPTLPRHIFLLSDHESRQLACDVANKLGDGDDSLRAEDFLYPLHEAIQMWTNESDWRKDYGDPRSITPELQDQINSLEAWFSSFHGDTKLGQIAWEECEQTLVDTTHVWRDATWVHIRPFLVSLQPHHYLVVDLLPTLLRLDYGVPPPRHLRPLGCTVDAIVAAILEASE